MKPRDKDAPAHKMTGKYVHHGKLTSPDGEMYAFNCATVKPDPNGFSEQGQIACTLQITVNKAAYEALSRIGELVPA